MQITLDFNEGVNPPDSARDVIIVIKHNKIMSNGYYSEKRGKYFIYAYGWLPKESIMWAEQPKNINNNKKTIV